MKPIACCGSLLAVVVAVAAVAALGGGAVAEASGLKKNFYKKTCPNAEEIVQRIIWKRVAKNSELAAKFLRVFFHDCIVRGCDASLLIDSTANNEAEKEARANSGLAGFDIIEEAKEAVEACCPGVVSCADIVALAARDSVSFKFKRPLWEVKTGRRDGRVSLKSEAQADIPSPASNFSVLSAQFRNKSLDEKDLVVLSGAHTIGIAHCNTFSQRLYNFTGQDRNGDTDPALDPKYAAFLKTKCTTLDDNTTTVPMDPGSSTHFDSHYYANLQKHRGMFVSDATLLTDPRARKLVSELSDSTCDFIEAFKISINKMGDIGVLTGKAGEIRKKCNVIN